MAVGKSVRLVVVIPVGPSSNLHYVLDTIDSVLHYTTPSRQIILVDDSGANVGLHVKSFVPEVSVMHAAGDSGTYGVLYLALSSALLYALENYDFQIVLKLDTDALVIGERPEDDAIRAFERNPKTGVLGSHRLDCNGEVRDFSGAARILAKHVSWVGLVQDPTCYFTLRRLLSMALANGYQPGENCLGGAYFISYECVRRLTESNLLLRRELRRSQLGEDHILGLLVRSLGIELGDFATGSLPMGLRWHGLPSSPATLVATGKKIIHSTRFWADMKEGEIRDFFRKLRDKESLLTV